MNSLLAKLPAFALPFVTRSLRGGRGKRYVTFSLLIAVATLLMSFWITLGSGSFEQELRKEFGFESSEWNRQQNEFVVFAHSQRELENLQEQALRLRQGGLGSTEVGLGYADLRTIADQGVQVLDRAAWSAVDTDEQERLRAQARALLDPQQARNWELHGFPQYYPWDDARQLEQLKTVIERQGVPAVVRYESPLGFSDALKVAGFLAGLILAACMTVFIPLLVAVQQAQERHENTLLPLTGTALNPRELALGLAAGPAVVVMIFAAPHLLVFGACALLVGDLVVALSLLAALAASGLFVTVAAQLLGHLVGNRRTPGVVAIALMIVLGLSWLIGAGLLTELNRETAGFAAVMPTLGLAGLLAETFGRLPVQRHFETLHLTAMAWSVAALVYAGLTLTALAHKIEGRPGAPLRSGAALLGALTSIVLINIAIPAQQVPYREEGLRMYLSLAGLSLPFSILLMARVPVGDEPPRLRRVPVAKLLAEFASWGAASVVVAVALSGFAIGDSLQPIALLWIGWCVVTLGLIAIRVVSVPASIPAHLFVGFCGASLIMGFVQAIYWAFDGGHSVEDVFALTKVSAVLGLLQVVVTFGIPLALLRSLRVNLGSLRST